MGWFGDAKDWVSDKYDKYGKYSTSYYLNPMNWKGDWAGDLKDWALGSSETEQMPTMTPEQLEAYNAQLQRLESLLGSPPQYGGNQYGDYMQNIIGQLSGGFDQPAYQIDPSMTQDFYEKAVYDPAQRDLERNLTSLRQRGSLHGSHQNYQERMARDEFTRNMAGERSKIFYQDELRKQQLATDAMNRRLQALGMGGELGMGMSNLSLNEWQTQQQMNQQYLNLLNAALGLSPIENIATVTDPGVGVNLNISPGG